MKRIFLWPLLLGFVACFDSKYEDEMTVVSPDSQWAAVLVRKGGHATVANSYLIELRPRSGEGKSCQLWSAYSMGPSNYGWVGSGKIVIQIEDTSNNRYRRKSIQKTPCLGVEVEEVWTKPSS